MPAKGTKKHMKRKLKTSNSRLSDLARRLLQAHDPLAGELLRRGLLSGRQVAELKAVAAPRLKRALAAERIGGFILAAELANADRQLAARAVFRGLLSCDELQRLDTMLKFQPRGKRTGKLDELTRIIERAIEQCEGGDYGNGH